MAETVPGPRTRRRGPPVNGEELRKPPSSARFDTAGVSLGVPAVALSVVIWLGVLGYAMWENSQDTEAIPRKVRRSAGPAGSLPSKSSTNCTGMFSSWRGTEQMCTNLRHNKTNQFQKRTHCVMVYPISDLL